MFTCCYHGHIQRISESWAVSAWIQPSRLRRAVLGTSLLAQIASSKFPMAWQRVYVALKQPKVGNSRVIEERQAEAGKWGISMLMVVYAEAEASVENLWPAAVQENKLFCNISCSDVMDVQMF